MLQPAIVIGISRQGIDYGAEDGLPSRLFFMIASPAGGANHHIEVLAELSTKLLEPGFIAGMQGHQQGRGAQAAGGGASGQPPTTDKVKSPSRQSRSIAASRGQLPALKQHLLLWHRS